MNFLKLLPRKKHSAGSSQSTSKLMSESGSFIDDLPAATSFATDETHSASSFSSSIRQKIMSLKNGSRPRSKSQLACPTPTPCPSRSVETASISDLEAKLRELSSCADAATSIESMPLPSMPLPSMPLPSMPLPSMPLPSMPLPSMPLADSVKKSSVAVSDSFEAELRKLDTKTRRVITDELDANRSWKALAGELNHPDRPSEKLFVESDILLLHDEKKVKSPTEEILKTWSTTGRNRPRIQDLYDVLVAILQLKVAKQLMFDVKGVRVSLSFEADSEPFVGRQPDGCCSTALRDCEDVNTNFCKLKACLSKVYQICYDEIESATDSFSPLSLSKIAEGNFGIVYRVKINGEDMAVKLFKEDMQQFANEIDKLSTLNHPNVLALYGVAVGEDSMCMITRFMPNGSLQQMLASKLLEWRLRFRILRDVTAGLEYVHSFNIMHRDVKPANILLDVNMNALIADFGLARQKNSFCTSRTDYAAGTSLYMAPEARYGSLVLVSDVYSFGVVALEVFTGLPVYDASRDYEMLTEYIVDKTAKELCDRRMKTHPSSEIQEDCFRCIQSCLKHKLERLNMKQANEEFTMYFDRICNEE